MSDLKLQGSSGYFKEVKPTVRQLQCGVSPEQVKKATANNNLDEIVVKDAKGRHFVAYADELSVKSGALPKVGDKVNLPFLDEVEVLHVDDEWNEDLGAGLSQGMLGGAAAAAGALLGLKLIDDGGLKGSDAKLQQLTYDPKQVPLIPTAEVKPFPIQQAPPQADKQPEK